MRIDREDVMAAARTKGVTSIHEVAYAILVEWPRRFCLVF